MAIEDKLYEDILTAIKAFRGCGRTAYVRSQLVALAKSILKHYGYDVVEAKDNT